MQGHPLPRRSRRVVADDQSGPTDPPADVYRYSLPITTTVTYDQKAQDPPVAGMDPKSHSSQSNIFLSQKQQHQQSPAGLKLENTSTSSISTTSSMTRESDHQSSTFYVPEQSMEGLIPVTFRETRGSLITGDDEYLCFATENGAIVKQWAWKKLETIYLDSRHNSITIIRQNKQKEDIVLYFGKDISLAEVQQSLLTKIHQAKQSIDAASEQPNNFGSASNSNHPNVSSMELEMTQMKETIAKLAMRDTEVQKELATLKSEESKMKQELEELRCKVTYSKTFGEKSIRVLPDQVLVGENSGLDSPFGDLDPHSQTATEEWKGLLGSTISRRLAVEWHSPFGETSYTLLYLHSVQSTAFWYAMFIYCLQMSTIILTLGDVIHPESNNNALLIPPMVAPTVTGAQFVALFMLLPYTSDVIEAAIKVQDGYYPELMRLYPGATYSKWAFSCIAQLLAGSFLLVASFVLTMQVDSVIDVMLNLTALLFMTEIDDLGFAMAKLGFVSNELQEQARSIADLQVPKRQRSGLYRKLLYLITLVGLLTGFGILKQRQLHGYYLSTYIYVQYGGGFNSKIPYYSGILASGTDRTSSRRKYRDLGTDNILLSYCEEVRAWTFSDVDDPCAFFAKSSRSSEYDVTAIPDSQWEVMDSLNRLQPFDKFSLVGRDCNPESCQGTCGSDGLCKCDHDQFGMDCEFPLVCEVLVLDERFPPFPIVTVSGQVFDTSHTFRLLKNPSTNEYVRVYDMPVYYSNQTYPANVIFYAGRRWILTSEWDLFNLTEAEVNNPATKFFPEKTVATLENQFHAHHQATYTPLFISDPVDFHTPEFQPTPEGVVWWTVQKVDDITRTFKPDNPLTTVLQCEPQSCIGMPDEYCAGEYSQCNNQTAECDCDFYADLYGDRCQYQKPCYDTIHSTRCKGHGVCSESSGNCRCNDPYFGKLCEKSYKCYEEAGSCQNGGICNPITGDCDCPSDPAVSGIACEQRAHCSVFGCANGGLCGPNGVCLCHPPFYGTHCDLIDTTQTELFCSTDEDCVNGSCDTATGICNCEDPSRYGTLCEHQFDCTNVVEELQSKCLNYGTCNDGTGLCECEAPYFGPDCAQVPKCTQKSDCGDEAWEGNCDIGSGRCVCEGGLLQGRMCTKSIEDLICAIDADCHWSGTCNSATLQCDCPVGRGGTLCEAMLVGSYDTRIDDYECSFELGYCSYRVG